MKPRKEYHCIDCGRPLLKGAKRCYECDEKLRREKNIDRSRAYYEQNREYLRQYYKERYRKKLETNL